jgi:large subunit ribosomal protein L3
MRTGLLAKKLGMTRVFDLDGKTTPVTVLSTEGCIVTGVKDQAKDGYTAVQLGLGISKDKHYSKPLKGHFAKLNVEPRRHLKEFRIDPSNRLEVGQSLSVTHFMIGQTVDVTAVTIGKGFAGVMKRHNFGGLRASHGVSVSHRSHGSTGGRQDPGKVFKNKKMAGHMGATQITTQNLKVIAIDEARQLLLVKGAVPGAKGSIVEIYDAIKKKQPEGLPLPAGLKQAA